MPKSQPEEVQTQQQPNLAEDAMKNFGTSLWGAIVLGMGLHIGWAIIGWILDMLASRVH